MDSAPPSSSRRSPISLSPSEDAPAFASPPPPLKKQRTSKPPRGVRSQLQLEPENKARSKDAEEGDGVPFDLERPGLSLATIVEACCRERSPCTPCSARNLICTWDQAGGPPSHSSVSSVADGGNIFLKSMRQVEINRAEIARLSREVKVLAKLLRLSPEECERLGIEANKQVTQAQPQQVRVSKEQTEVRKLVAFDNSANPSSLVPQASEKSDNASRAGDYLPPFSFPTYKYRDEPEAILPSVSSDSSYPSFSLDGNSSYLTHILAFQSLGETSASSLQDPSHQ
ncbi:hypothetical protein JCM5350_008102 [Sporobolomyces pararoseus]